MADGSFVQQCPQCNARYQIFPPNYGRRIKCSACGAEFRAATPQPVPPPPPPVSEPSTARFGPEPEEVHNQFDFGSMPSKRFSSYEQPRKTKSQNLNLVILLSVVAMFMLLAIGMIAGSDEPSRSGRDAPGIGTLIFGPLVLVALGLAYFAPVAIAYSRDHRNTLPIAILCVFLGWSLVAWVVALAWALSSDVKQSRVYVKKVIVRKGMDDDEDDENWN